MHLQTLILTAKVMVISIFQKAVATGTTLQTSTLFIIPPGSAPTTSSSPRIQLFERHDSSNINNTSVPSSSLIPTDKDLAGDLMALQFVMGVIIIFAIITIIAGEIVLWRRRREVVVGGSLGNPINAGAGGILSAEQVAKAGVVDGPEVLVGG